MPSNPKFPSRSPLSTKPPTRPGLTISRSHDPDLSTPSTAAEIYRLTNNWSVGDSFITLAGKGSAKKKVPPYYPESIGPTPSARGLGRLGDWEEKSRGRGVEAWEVGGVFAALRRSGGASVTGPRDLYCCFSFQLHPAWIVGVIAGGSWGGL